MKLALVGNCSYQALIDDSASVRWLCWPRFDSPFVFGGLLDEERGGEFSVQPADEHFGSRQSYLSNTNVLCTHFESRSGSFDVVDFAPRFKQYGRSFKPTMLVRILRPRSGRPWVRVRCRPVTDQGRSEPAFYTASNHVQWLLPDARLRLTTDASLTWVSEGRPFALERPTYLVLAWGEPLEAPLAETCEAFFERTRTYWERWVSHCTLPELYQEEVARSALALKLHQFEDTGAITAATTTSLPEHPGSGRTWDYRYCWLRDSCFTLGALRRLGQFEEVEGFATYLMNIAGAEGDLQPVYGINGRSVLEEDVLEHLAGFRGEGPVRIGNAAHSQRQHDVYGELLASLAPLHLDIRFRRHGEWRSTDILHRLLERLAANLEAPDCGLWEKRQEPRLHAFSLLMHWAGARAAEHVGRRRGDAALAEEGAGLSSRAAELLETRCWRSSPGFFADSVDGHEPDASLLMMVNLGFLDPGGPRAASHVAHLASALKANEHLLYRYRHDDGLGATEAAFTVCGFWHAEALARMGRRDESEAVFLGLLSHANHLGLMSEDVDPTTGEAWGNFPQTYSHVGVINAASVLSPLASPLL